MCNLSKKSKVGVASVNTPYSRVLFTEECGVLPATIA
jgi:hypothetical protein